jgi:RimJ/RimL family protein N-acetyltransferase
LTVLETPRLIVRRLEANDAAFILELLNEPSWIENIGDRDIHSPDDARRYLDNGPLAMYLERGFGLYLVALKSTLDPVGICGLIKRETLADVDLGFALLERYWGHGYAFEAASAVMAYEPKVIGLSRVVAIATPSNHRSVSLLEKLGFRFEQPIRLDGDGEALALYAIAT